ncbi:transcriptional regulator with XRE-family HTH domain [Pararhizobium capsulatum DSM 1112]|uniref:Transcriptional regulator with XRE-family HTH domain n=1 Tax=Pararhizobium capsulatum DSM 1112 TaxID=1121113 RepID=A0ABU0BW57_9HYPH|nr:XRE family transcriptional regulator [Pararhizobium capsulatum]MDQ0322497.1 transcriptional regulator with XRE-family HTH domain [Pararhizobium capsulatum DSM 1112]
MTEKNARPTGRDSALGNRLRVRRKQQKLTMQEVADQAGFSVGFISQIERGITVPSLVSLIAVCRALDLDVGSVFEKTRSAEPVTRRDARTIFGLGAMTGQDVTYERLSAAFPGNILRSTLIHEPPGYRSEPMTHEGEEIFYIIDGALSLELDGERVILEAGDTAHFPSTRVHATWNHTGSTTTVFHTCTMDVFGDGELSGVADSSLVVTRGTGRSKPESPRS